MAEPGSRPQGRPRVLIVDDEPNLLESVKRHQRRHFDLTLASSGAEALERVADGETFAVVVSDLTMPRMDGIELLQRIRDASPETTRIMLTGNADLEVAKRAVNDGQIFRFLTKPSPPDDLQAAIRSGVEMHRLVVSEKELLEQTLQGAVRVLTEILGLVNPAAFGRASRVRKRVTQIARAMGISEIWRLEIAAMLSQIGCVTVPAQIIEKLGGGASLSATEQKMIRAHPEIGAGLIRGIPRLEEVAEMIAFQGLRFDGRGSERDAPEGDAIPLGARLLRVALDLDQLESRGRRLCDALDELEGRKGIYDPAILATLRGLDGFEPQSREIEVRIGDLCTGMVIAEDIRSEEGLLLIAAGQQVSAALVGRLINWRRDGHRLREPVRVIVDPEAAEAEGESP
ncbi:MAG: HD domain-containing phosphohydrolase [Myxococcota bacterium]